MVYLAADVLWQHVEMRSRLASSSLVVLLASSLATAGCPESRAVRRDAGTGRTDAAVADATFVAPDAFFGTTDAGTFDATMLDAPIAIGDDAFVASADAFVGRDAFAPPDAFVARDAFLVPDAFVARDAFVTPDAFAPVATTAPFPATGDPRVASADLYFWRAGDNVQGTRTLGVSPIRELTMNLVLEPNGLTCDTQDVRVSINGTTVGTFSIATPDTTIARTFSFAPITGPNYTFRYETTREVGSGCGSAGYANDRSTVTVR